jgi:hypothetical protein
VRSGETVVVLIAGFVMIALTVVLSWLFLGSVYERVAPLTGLGFCCYDALRH